MGALIVPLSAAVARACPAVLQPDRDDLVQSAMTRILRRAGTGATFSPAYLRATARNAVRNALRSRARAPARVALDPGSIHGAAAVGCPELALRRRHVASAIRRAIRALPEPRRRAVTRLLVGDRVADIAARYGWTTKRAENLAYRGLQSLRTLLAADGIVPATTTECSCPSRC